RNRVVGSIVHLEGFPWSINTSVMFDFKRSVLFPYLINLVIVLFFLHIVFLLVRQRLIRREIAKEMERIESDKLKLIGLIAASTAHEIRNPLTGIKGFITLLSKKYKD